MTSSDIARPLPKRWRIHHRIPKDIDSALNEFSPLMRQLLYNRGFMEGVSASSFIAGEVNFSTDPLLLKDMDLAVKRLFEGITSGEIIAIYGDYDADGVTATALMAAFLSALGVKPRVYIPNRYDEGYGLNEEAIRQLAAEGTDLIITVDCGVRAVYEVTLANELGMAVIISDHHNPGKVLPPALAVIDPKQPGDLYPEKYLAGVGLAYKLAQAYLMTHPQAGIDADDWLDLVAIGTVADLAPLRQGIFSLAQVARIDLTKCDASNIGFGLAPRLNAAGRLDSALTAFELLTTQNVQNAGLLAQELEKQNSDRQEMTQEIREKAIDQVLTADPDALLFFAASPEFSEGVVGLAASRLTEAYYRPAIIGHQGAEFTVASCRSIPEFDITRALDACSELLVRHGGHAAAAGFTVRVEDQEELIERLRAIAQDELGEMELLPTLDIDREILLDKLDAKYIPGILEDLHQLEPTGRENPEPIFASQHIGVRHARTVGREGTHLKLILQAGAHAFDGIAFRQGYWMAELPDVIDIAYRFELNEFNGRSNLQLNIKDIHQSE